MNNATKNAENVQKIKSLVLCYENFIRIHMKMEMQWEIEKSRFEYNIYEN